GRMERPIPIHLELDSLSPDEAVRAPRWLLRLQVRGSLPDVEENFLVHNLSETGVLIESSIEVPAGSMLALDLPLIGVTEAKIEWASGSLFGCSFLKPIPTEAITAALLKEPLSRSINSEPHQPRDAGRDAARFRFRKHLKKLREKSGLSLEDVASKVKVSRQTVWYWETGKRTPSAQNLTLLANALGVSARELEAFDGLRRPEPLSFSEIKEWIALELGVPLQ